MGRMHSKGKGISSSALPYSRAPPSWLKTSPEEVVQQIVKLARKGVTPSQIGAQLRDSQGVAQVRFVTGNKILRILKSEGLAPEIPEDLYHLIVCTVTRSLTITEACCERAQASGAQPQGYGQQVPSHSHRVAYPPSDPLLQDRWCCAADLQVRVVDCLDSCGINLMIPCEKHLRQLPEVELYPMLLDHARGGGPGLSRTDSSRFLTAATAAHRPLFGAAMKIHLAC